MVPFDKFIYKLPTYQFLGFLPRFIYQAFHFPGTWSSYIVSKHNGKLLLFLKRNCALLLHLKKNYLAQIRALGLLSVDETIIESVQNVKLMIKSIIRVIITIMYIYNV